MSEAAVRLTAGAVAALELAADLQGGRGEARTDKRCGQTHGCLQREEGEAQADRQSVNIGAVGTCFKKC